MTPPTWDDKLHEAMDLFTGTLEVPEAQFALACAVQGIANAAGQPIKIADDEGRIVANFTPKAEPWGVGGNG